MKNVKKNLCALLVTTSLGIAALIPTDVSAAHNGRDKGYDRAFGSSQSTFSSQRSTASAAQQAYSPERRSRPQAGHLGAGAVDSESVLRDSPSRVVPISQANYEAQRSMEALQTSLVQIQEELSIALADKALTNSAMDDLGEDLASQSEAYEAVQVRLALAASSHAEEAARAAEIQRELVSKVSGLTQARDTLVEQIRAVKAELEDMTRNSEALTARVKTLAELVSRQEGALALATDASEQLKATLADRIAGNLCQLKSQEEMQRAFSQECAEVQAQQEREAARMQALARDRDSLEKALELTRQDIRALTATQAELRCTLVAEREQAAQRDAVLQRDIEAIRAQMEQRAVAFRQEQDQAEQDFAARLQAQDARFATQLTDQAAAATAAIAQVTQAHADSELTNKTLLDQTELLEREVAEREDKLAQMKAVFARATSKTPAKTIFGELRVILGIPAQQAAAAALPVAGPLDGALAGAAANTDS